MSSQFTLQHEKDYSFHPNLVRYFIPLTDAEFQERLEKHKGEIAVMLRSSEFNQDKTSLIVTNNPLPLLISGHEFTAPFDFFTPDLIGRMDASRKPYALPPLKAPPKTLLGISSTTAKKPTPFRFATDRDFKSEGQFSKSYAERRLQRMYPNLLTHAMPPPDSKRLAQLPRVESWTPQWEPLTISCLTETKPTLTAPGVDGFRYGKAPLWVINNSVVPRQL